jgi:hypothetical protein
MSKMQIEAAVQPISIGQIQERRGDAGFKLGWAAGLLEWENFCHDEACSDNAKA